MNDGKVVNITYNVKTEGTENAKQNIKSTTSSIVKNLTELKATMTAVGAAIGRISAKIINFTKDSADYIEQLNVLNVAFGNNTDGINKFISAYSQTLDLDDSTILKSTATFKTLANSMGYAEETGTKLSKLMSSMNLDVSSLYNMDFSKSQAMLQSAIMGQGRALQRATGASVLDTTVQTTLDTLGVDAYVSDMNFAEKSMARVIAITYQLRNAQGDLARTIESPANQFRILAEQVSLAARNIGNIFLPIVSKILPALNAVMLILNDILSTIAKLVGYKASDFDFGSGASSLADDYYDFSDAVASVGTQAEETSKKLSGLRGFDKLNVITTPTSASASTSTDTGGSSIGSSINPNLLSAFEGLGNWDSQLDGIKTKADEIRDKFYDWFGITKDSDGNLKASKKTLERIAEIIGGIVLIIIGVHFVKKLLEGKGALDSTSKSSKNMSKAAKKAATALEILSVGAAALMIFAGVALVLQEFSDLLETMDETGTSSWEVLGLLGGVLLELAGFIELVNLATKNIDTEQIIGIVAILGGLALILYSLGEYLKVVSESGYSVDEIMVVLITTFASLAASALILAAAAKLLSSPLALAAVVLVTASLVALLFTLKETLPTILDTVGDFIVKTGPTLVPIIQAIGGVLNELINTLGTVLPPIINSVGGLFKQVFDGISKVINSVGNTLTKVLNTLKSLVTTVLSAILNFVNGLGPAINNLVDNVITAVTKLINFIVSGMEYLVNNTVVKAVNGIIKALNKVLGLVGHSIKYASEVHIPRFKPQLYAEGGLPTKGQMFIMNEKEPELLGQIGGQSFVANQNQMMSLLDKKLSNAGGLQSATFVIKVGDEQIAKKVLKNLNNMAKANGKPIEITG